MVKHWAVRQEVVDTLFKVYRSIYDIYREVNICLNKWYDDRLAWPYTIYGRGQVDYIRAAGVGSVYGECAICTVPIKTRLR